MNHGSFGSLWGLEGSTFLHILHVDACTGGILAAAGAWVTVFVFDVL